MLETPDAVKHDQPCAAALERTSNGYNSPIRPGNDNVGHRFFLSPRERSAVPLAATRAAGRAGRFQADANIFFAARNLSRRILRDFTVADFDVANARQRAAGIAPDLRAAFFRSE